MKKNAVAIVIAGILAYMGFCVPGVSVAEKGYIDIRAAITQSLGEGISPGAEEFSGWELPDDRTVTILFYPWKNEVVLWGKDQQGNTEGTVWESELCVPLFGGYCGSWDNLSASLEEGYSLNIILQTEENGDFLLIDDAEKASIMYQAIMENME